MPDESAADDMPIGTWNDSDDEWQDMPIEHIGAPTIPNVLDENDSDGDMSPRTRRVTREAKLMRNRREHLRGRGTSAQGGTSNTAGQHLEIRDARGYDWRTRPGSHIDDSQPEPDGTGYTRLRLDDKEENAELQAATDYLFQEDLNRVDDADDPSAAPISQLAMTKRLLSEAQKIAYVGLCSTLSHHMVQNLTTYTNKETHPAIQSAKEWVLRVMIRLYQHLDIEPTEQSMIESLPLHGILSSDLAPSLVATQTIPNPAYNPQSAKQVPVSRPPSPPAPSWSLQASKPQHSSHSSEQDISQPASDSPPKTPPQRATPSKAEQMSAADPSSPSPNVLTDPNSAMQLAEHAANGPSVPTRVPEASLKAPPPSNQPTTSMPTLDGVSTEINEASKTITLDLRWTVLCDLFLVLTADSVYDARSRTLLEHVAESVGLTWMDVTKFEKRITDALEIEEDVQSLDDQSVTKKRELSSRNKRRIMMGLATLGGGLVIGLSAGLLAPVIGAGVGAALGAVGISGTSAFLGGVGGATIITTTGTISGATMGGRGMSRRIRSVQTFEFRPLHYHKRVNCIITVPGFLKGPEDDPTLPYSVIDPIMGDVFSIMWEPQMMQEMGNAMSILWNETLVQGVQQVLAATVAGAMFSALAWPLWLTKLNYLIDNPWSNATERARTAGLVLADVLINRQMGVRPITLVGYSLGARMIFFALLELARRKAFGIVQNVYLMGAPVTSREYEWRTARSVVSGRFVNAYARSDWLLAYLHRATAGGVRSIAGLHPVDFDCGIDNIDVTNIVPGHLAYRALTPLVLGELGFQTTADYFDEPESLDHVPERSFETGNKPAEPATAAQKLKNLFWGNKAQSTSSAYAPPTPVGKDNHQNKPKNSVIYDAFDECDTPKPDARQVPTTDTNNTDDASAATVNVDKPEPVANAKGEARSNAITQQMHPSAEANESATSPSSHDNVEPLTELSKEGTSIVTPEPPQPPLQQEDGLQPRNITTKSYYIPADTDASMPSFATYGLAPDEAAKLAAQFNSMSTSTSMPVDSFEPADSGDPVENEWGTQTQKDGVTTTSSAAATAADTTRPSSTAEEPSDLPDWASKNPWG